MLFVPPPRVKRPGYRRFSMSSEHPDQDTLYEEANRLYWESDQSVNQIGEALDLSKGVLYGLIAALPSGFPCPQCGDEMVFPNRTAREKGFLACPECGMEEEETSVRSFWEEQGEYPVPTAAAESGGPSRGPGTAFQRAFTSGKAKVAGLSPRGRAIAGTALLGIAAGLVLGTYFRRR
jgi:hypothetical protein